MAKTLSELITESRKIIGQTDSSNSQISDSQLTTWLNDAYESTLITLRHIPKKSADLAVTAQAVTLDDGTLTIDSARLKNPDNSEKYADLEVISLDELMALDPDWENATATFPTHLVRTGVLTASLYPPPKASVIALTTPLRLYGLEAPDAMSASSDTPSLLPAHLHRILPHWAAFRSFSALNDEPRATQQLTLFRGQVKDNKAIATEFSRKLGRWKWA